MTKERGTAVVSRRAEEHAPRWKLLGVGPACGVCLRRDVYAYRRRFVPGDVIRCGEHGPSPAERRQAD